MNVMIDRQPWDELLDGLKEKDTVSALHILTALEQANEEETEQFFDDLAEKQISVDTFGFIAYCMSTAAACCRIT